MALDEELREKIRIFANNTRYYMTEEPVIPEFFDAYGKAFHTETDALHHALEELLDTSSLYGNGKHSPLRTMVQAFLTHAGELLKAVDDFIELEWLHHGEGEAYQGATTLKMLVERAEKDVMEQENLENALPRIKNMEDVNRLFASKKIDTELLLNVYDSFSIENPDAETLGSAINGLRHTLLGYYLKGDSAAETLEYVTDNGRIIKAAQDALRHSITASQTPQAEYAQFSINRMVEYIDTLSKNLEKAAKNPPQQEGYGI